ncbi:hypothetical protein DVA81_19480, partial [Acinetobacter baumannii]
SRAEAEEEREENFLEALEIRLPNLTKTIAMSLISKEIAHTFKTTNGGVDRSAVEYNHFTWQLSLLGPRKFIPFLRKNGRWER